MAPQQSERKPLADQSDLYLGHFDDLVAVLRGIHSDVGDFVALVVQALGPEPNQYGRSLLSMCTAALNADLKAEAREAGEEEILRYLAGR